MKLSLSEAARRAGVSRVTIYKKVKAGAISTEPGEDGKPVIDLSELARVYPKALSDNVVNLNSEVYTPVQVENTPEYRLLRAELEHTRQRVADMERRAETAEADKAVLTRLLTDQREKPAPAPATDIRDEEIRALVARVRQLEKRGFWDMVLGRKPAAPARPASPKGKPRR